LKEIFRYFLSWDIPELLGYLLLKEDEAAARGDNKCWLPILCEVWVFKGAGCCLRANISMIESGSLWVGSLKKLFCKGMV